MAGAAVLSRGTRRSTRGAGLFCALSIGCATAPPAPVVPSWQRGNPGLEVGDRERALWDEDGKAIAELEKTDLFIGDPPLDALLADLVRSLAPPLDERAPELRVYVVATADRNAAANANGAMFVSIGLLSALQNDSELAALLGHEIAHVVLRHGLVSRQYEELTESTVDRQKLSRHQEWEADAYAFDRMVAAGYDPAAMHQMMRRLDSGSEPPGQRIAAWESHPDLDDRIDAARSRSAEVERAPVRTDRYEPAISGILLRAAELEIEAGEFERAQATIDRHLASVPNSGRAWYLKAEIARRTLPEGHRSATARTAYERAVELDPEYPEALRALGLLLRETGETDRARDLLERYLRAAPDAVDRAVIERYLRSPAAQSRT